MTTDALAVTPDFDAFRSRYEKGQPQLVFSRIVNDLETPVSAMLKLMVPGEPAFLLESVEGGEVRGRYSILGIAPDLTWRCHGNQAQINRKGTLEDRDFIPCDKPSLDAFRDLLAESKLDFPPGLPPMAAGVIGYMSYDMVRLMERLPEKNKDNIGIPDGYFMRPQIMAIFDSVAGVIFIATPVWKSEVSPKIAYERALQRIDTAQTRLAASLPEQARYHAGEMRPVTFTPNMTREHYYGMVDRAKEYIRAGDIFQVVLSQRFSVPFEQPHFALYRALRHLNPSPFLFYLNFGNFTLVGSSPEILVRLRNETVTIRPIAGTRKRGRDAQEDQALEKDLLADPKELAEHLMLLDLGRNDVGRIAKVGSVKVTDKMKVERYSHVMHIVSNVEGILDAKYDALDALVAGFPAGTVSGAPKIRAMEIIEELEPERRSFYAGCAGYFSANGSMDTCISLRTGLLKDGMLHVQAGGGIVADSDPEGEYQESLNKAKALMRAAEEAIKFA